MKIIILSPMKSTTSVASSAAFCLLLGAANLHAQDRPPEQGQRESDLQQTRQRMMDRRHEDFPEPEGSPRGLAPDRSGAPARTADSGDLDLGPRHAGRFEDGPAAPDRPAPFMRDGGRRFGHPGRPGEFRAQPDNGPGFPPPPRSGGRPASGGFGSYSGDLDQGPRHAGWFEDGPAAPSRPAPFMRDGGRPFGHPGRPGDFRAQPDGGPSFPPPPMSWGRPESEGFGSYSGDLAQAPRRAGWFEDGPAAPGRPAPFMRDGGRPFGHPGRPGDFRAQPDGGPGFPPPPMSWGRPESRGFGHFSGDMAQGPRPVERFEDGPSAPGGPAPFMHDGGRRFDHPDGPGDFRAQPDGGPGFPH